MLAIDTSVSKPNPSLQSSSESETQNWLFSVQSAIALNLESILRKPIAFKHKITRSKKWWQQDLRNFKPLDYREEIENLDDLGITEHISQVRFCAKI